jgi:hypothetical protein
MSDLPSITPPAVRVQRDPFTPILKAIGLSLLVGLTLFILGIATNQPVLSAIAALVTLVMLALAAVAAVALGAWISIRRSSLKFALSDLFWLTLMTALGCSFFLATQAMAQAISFTASVVTLSFWWAMRVPATSWLERGTRFIVSGFSIAAALLIIAFFFTMIAIVFGQVLGR